MHDAPRVSPVNQISHHATFEQCCIIRECTRLTYTMVIEKERITGLRNRWNKENEERFAKRETRGFRPPDAAIKSEGAPPRETRKAKECERAKESERDGRVIEAEFE